MNERNKLELPIEIRAGVLEDIPFIMGTWMNQHRYSAECSYLPERLYKERYRPLIANILSRSSVLVAVNPEDVTHIYGYIVVEYTDQVAIIHYAYTKSTFQNMGVFRRLKDFALPNNSEITPITFVGRRFKHMQHSYRLTYNPFLR